LGEKLKVEMSFSLTMTVADAATPAVERLAKNLTSQRLAAAVGPACARVVQRHLRGLGANKRGWPTTNFYPRAAKATNWRPDTEGALISVNQVGMRQRYHGGPISPVKKRMLAIPISPVSYGHLPSDFKDLVLLRTKKGAYLVQYGEQVADATKKKGKRGGPGGGNARRRMAAFLNFLFVLRGGVTQKQDHGVLPSHEAMARAAKDAILAALRLESDRS
jgi:hypothetical protein